jgi:Bacterial Ig domain/Bacterial Ig-like domain (group 1)
MGHLRFATIGLVATALLSCGGDDLVLPSEGEPAAITIVQGNGQSGRVGEVLAKPLVVRVRDGVDRPVAGATVVVELDAGSAEPDTISTNADGQGTAQITLGTQPGESNGAVRVVAPESPVAVEASFTVVAVAASANGLAAVSGDGQTGVAGTALADPLVVRVTDAFGNPIEGVAIAWTAGGGGSVSAPSTTTDAEGLTSVTRTLGPAAGAQTTLASSEGLAGSPVLFNHTATAGNPSGVLIVAGDDQSAPPGTTLPVDLVVAVVDADSNPVVGAAVTWVVTGGGGSLDPTTGTTDASGRASTRWTLGAAAGANIAQAIVSGVGQAEFTATAAAGSAAQILIVSGDDQTGQAGTALGSPLVVRVLDAGDNPVSNVPVTWTVQSGGGSVSPPSATTGADGQATTAWTLGAAVGAQRVRAAAPGAGSVQFSATATVGAPAALGLVTQPSAQAQMGVPFARQPVVQIRDAVGNPVRASGVTVTAAIATGDGAIGGTATQTTGANGRATFTNLEIGGAVGAHSLIFAAPGLSSVTSAGINVNPVESNTAITSDSPDPSAPGQAVEVVFEVTSPGGTPSGTVEVTASGGSESCSAPVATGRCSITLTAEGSRTLTATFQGSTLFRSSSGNTSHSVVTPDTPPNAVDDGYSATTGVQLSVPAPGVLGNDVDVDGDPLTAELVPGSGPTGGTLTLRPDGSFDYLPNLEFGEDTFEYRVTAGSASDVARVTIIVN